MKTDVADFSKRHKRYDNIDGTGEIFMGLMLLAFALVGIVQSRLPEHSVWRTNGLASILLMYVVLFSMLGLGWLIQRWVKMHITWPRTGYVAFLRAKDLPAEFAPPAARWSKESRLAGVFVGSAVLAAAIAVMAVVVDRRGIVVLPRVLYGGFMAAAYSLWVRWMGGGRAWKWLLAGLMALGLAALAWLIPGNFAAFMRPVIGFSAAVWILSGALTLAGYIRRTPPPAGEAS